LQLNDAQGYILFAVMILQVILSLFTINLIENIALDQHAVADELVYRDDATILTKIIKTMSTMDELTSQACQVGHMSSNALKLQPLEWWQSNACHINVDNRPVWYVIEKISSDDCVQYLRLTLNSEPHTMLLQGNIAISLPLPQLCENKIYKASPGLLNHYFL